MTFATSKTIKSFALATCATSVLILGAAASAQGADLHEFEIAPQNLGDALAEFSVQGDAEVYWVKEDVAGKRTDGVNGPYTKQEAIEKLLDDAGVDYRVDENGTLLVGDAYLQRATLDEETPPAPFRVAQLDQKEDVREIRSDNDFDTKRREDVIVVTGTSISGAYPNAVPVQTLEAADIEALGAVNFEDLLSRIPQNLGDFNTTAPFAVQGRSGGSSRLNLRGLGTGASLLLINGRRAVSPGGVGFDLSLIPLAAVERIEILSDGASAVYGSDAIGGVVNVILRDDADGAETHLSFGTVTDGSHSRLKAEQNLGFNWDGGNLMAGYSFAQTTDLDASDREFSNSTGSPFALIPEDERHSGVLSLNQKINESFKVGADVMYAQRSADSSVTRQAVGGSVWRLRRDSEQVFATLKVAGKITEKTNLEVAGTYSEIWNDNVTFVDGAFRSGRENNSAYWDVSAKIDGELFDLPAGPLRFAVGGDYAQDDYFTSDANGNATEADRNSAAVFGELLVPLVSEQNALPGVQSLELNIAARHSDYSDFGSDFSPRVGLSWAPVEGLNLRGTYSEGFRAPSLSILGGIDAGGTFLVFSPSALFIPDAFSNDNSSVYLVTTGIDAAGLGPEESESFTIGADIKPGFLPGLDISATYFNIEYVNRIAAPDPSFVSIFLDPLSFPSQITLNPSADDIARLIEGNDVTVNTTTADPTDPASLSSVVTVALDNRTQNIAESAVDGLDLQLSYTTETDIGSINVGGNFTFLFDSTDVLVPGSPEFERLNSVGNPADFRGRAFVGLTRDRLSAQLNFNYVDGYTNILVNPNDSVDSWETFDFTANYDFGSANGWVLSDLSLNLSILNVFDQDPPLVNVSQSAAGLIEPIGFDPANASPVGRFVQVGLRKKF